MVESRCRHQSNENRLTITAVVALCIAPLDCFRTASIKYPANAVVTVNAVTPPTIVPTQKLLFCGACCCFTSLLIGMTTLPSVLEIAIA